MELIENINTYDINKHSRKVQRIYILCITLIMLGVLILFIQLNMNSTKDDDFMNNSITDSSEMIGPQYKGQTSNGNDYLITSKTAKELDDGLVLLNSPVANFNDNLSDFVLESLSGIYDDNNKILTLTDNVELDDKEGNSFSASEIKIDLEKNIIYSDNKIDLTGKIGKITADGMEIRQDDNVIIFKGKVKMTIKEKK